MSLGSFFVLMPRTEIMSAQPAEIDDDKDALE